ncbi:MAG: TldD/PmbA family protein [Candidatus Syntropharchaeia archaeon]
MDIDYILDHIKADYVEIRIQKSSEKSIRYREGSVEEFHSFDSVDIGIRALKNGCWAISHTSDLRRNTIEDLVSDMKRTMERLPRGDVEIAYSKPHREKREIKGRNMLEEKISFLDEIQSPLADDFLIWGSPITYSEIKEYKRIVTSEGTDVEEKIPFFSLSCSISTKKSSYTKNFGFSGEIDRDMVRDEMKKMHSAVIDQLHAKSVRGGKYTVILGPSLTGLFVEEVVGHPAEGDFIAEGKSPFSKLIGEEIAPDFVSVVDSPVEGSFGFSFFDDEGIPTRKKEIIKDGVLTDCIHDRESAGRLEEEPNGGGRGIIGMLPSPRISTIYIEKGDFERDELFDIEYGIYADGATGGYVSIPEGRFQINAQGGYIIEKGEISHPLLEVSIKGKIEDALMKIEAVGRDFMIANAGFDGKKGQSIPVSTGGPSIRISEIFVG